MDVRDAMETDVVTCAPDDVVSETVRRLREHDVSGMPVVDGDGALVGVVSEADLLDLIDERQEDSNIWLPSPFEAIELPLRAFPFRDWLEKHDLVKEELEDIGEIPIERIMSRDVATAAPGDSVEQASHVMIREAVNRLPVVEDGELVGILTRGDVLDGIARRADRD
jgi:CBS domain-containing protein